MLLLADRVWCNNDFFMAFLLKCYYFVVQLGGDVFMLKFSLVFTLRVVLC